ncbi:MAG: DNA-binding protein [Minisyncoccales bacterium]
MNLDKLFNNKNYLKKQIETYVNKKQIRISEPNKLLALAHLEKAKQNLLFFDKNFKDEEFLDWLIVILYYVVYHCALALISKKGFYSKNHLATLILLVQNYDVSKKEINLMEELCITRKDAELYTVLKSERQNASYSSKTNFTIKKVGNYKNEVISFLYKTEDLLKEE